MTKNEIFDKNVIIVRRNLNIVNDGLIIKIPSERLDFVAREIVVDLSLEDRLIND